MSPPIVDGQRLPGAPKCTTAAPCAMLVSVMVLTGEASKALGDGGFCTSVQFGVTDDGAEIAPLIGYRVPRHRRENAKVFALNFCPFCGAKLAPEEL